MSVDRGEVERIASLARLRFDEGQADRLTDEMNDILEHAARLRRLREAPPEHESETSRSGTRPPDAERPDPLSGDVAAFAPQVREGFFVVPPPPGLSPGGPTDQNT